MNKWGIYFIFLLLAASASLAIPPIPPFFGGSVKIDGNFAPDGTDIKALVHGIVYGQDLTESGFYVLYVNGDDPSTPAIEGGVDGDIISFTVNGQPAPQTGIWQSGNITELALTSTSACIDNDQDGYGNPGSASCLHGSARDCNDTNVNINPGATEVCNNVDDNCNGATDEGTLWQNKGTSCSAGIGACLRTGIYVCSVANPSGPTVCNAVAGQPSTETCDGIDNDCNGVIDNGFNLGQSCTVGVGECIRTGSLVCKTDHTGTQCSATAGTPATEICDNKDNDCDGTVDESLTRGTTCGVGACAGNTGTETCAAGVWGGNTCNPLAGATTEICDNIDNDCDGTKDESLTRGTTCGVGICAGNIGTETCSAGVWGSNTCNPFARATTEICDGLDNDCDGTVDEGCQCTNGATRQCGSNVGECRYGTETCSNGAWGTCSGGVSAATEICDNKDNDCNGVIDNGFNLGQSCSVGVGACLRSGTLVCKTDFSGTQCSATAGTPGTEICDNIDNDCDGTKDESITRATTCGVGICAGNTGSETCSVGVWGSNTCNPFARATTEICDGIDNDCDGTTDEGCQCTNGATRQCGSNVGECRFGTETCSNGAWGTCSGGVTAVAEKCDGKDNDCNGITDNGFNLGQICSVGVGACLRTGTLVCKADFSGTQCSAVAGTPGTEICGDGIDNDCDGTADEGCVCTNGATRQCGTSNVGECKFGTETCTNGAWGACVGNVSSSAEKCDGKDNDCDGITDDGFNLGQSCSAGVGFCLRTGTLVCKADFSGTQCSATPGTPATEVCDGIDNDCDGTTDEGCLCTNGAVRQCGSNIGECRYGTETCANGRWGLCTGGITPATELCDGKDNDCDGITDEYCQCIAGATRNCGSNVGECRFGTQTCSAYGSWGSCSGGTNPASEKCDSKDNDCDGKTDEVFTLGQACSLGVGACFRAGNIVCKADGTGTQCSATAGTPGTEICDGLDNDCDGITDEGCSISGSPQELKEQAVTLLGQAIDRVCTAKSVECYSLQTTKTYALQSLNSKYWVSDERLSTEIGASNGVFVFTYEAKALSRCKLLKTPECRQASQLFGNADEKLAKIALDDAKAAATQNKAWLAERYYNYGLKFRDSNTLTAIMYFKLSWSESQRVIKMAR